MVALPSKRTSIIIGVVAVVVLAGGGIAIAVSGGGGKSTPTAQASTTPVATTTAPTPTPTPTTSAAVKVPSINPLTGLGPKPSGPVFAVKIDDTDNGRPQRGVDKADVVYIEQAEGGLTRTVQVFASNKPTVEAVRSVRASDAELLSQYGAISLVASGGGGDSLTTLDASIVKGIINDRGGPGFSRDGNREAPYNLTSDLASLSASQKTAGVKDIGFRFAVRDPRVSAAPNGASVNAVVGQTPITFTWDSAHSAYVRVIDGVRATAADGALVGAANVIVQYCQVTANYGDVDVNGQASKFTHSVGSGRAILFRNGRKVVGKWSRPSTTAPTTFTDAAGKVLYQAPGQTYVLLATA